MKKVVKKKKLRIFRLLLLLLLLGGVFFLVDLYLDTKIENIIIKNTSYLEDDYILELAKVSNYPSFYFTKSKDIEKRLMKSPYIKKVSISKGFYHVLTIDIVENKPLFFYEPTKKIVFANKKTTNQTNYNFRIPRVINYIPNTKYNSFINNMDKVSSQVLGDISDIEYTPNEYDKDRFLLYMDDDNSVYLTLTKFKMINYYEKVLPQLDGKKGILYLDSGNHFKIME